MLEPEQQRHPGGAADAGEADALAAQVLGPFDVGLRHQVEVVAAAEGGDDFQVLPAGDGGQRGAAAGAADLYVARRQCGDENRRAADKHRFDVDAVLVEESTILRHPKRQGAARAGIAEDDFAGGRRERETAPERN